jgi:hypothetical protein
MLFQDWSLVVVFSVALQIIAVVWFSRYLRRRLINE